MRVRPALLLISSLYPTQDRPEVGSFVARRVGILRSRNIRVTVVAAKSYRSGIAIRYGRMLLSSLTAHGPFAGVETHALFPTGILGLVAAWLRRVPHVTYVHGSDVAISAQRSWLHRRIARIVARAASVVVVNSRYTASLVEGFGVTAVIVSPGIDLAVFKPGSRNEARRVTGLPDSARIALFVGRLSEDKGADVFAQALSLVDGWVAVMVGTGELESKIAADYPSILLKGRSAPDAVAVWLQSADVVVIPSRAEGLGLVAIEALACGIPVIASAVGGLVETVRHDQTGILVKPGDPRALADALVRLESAQVREAYATSAPASVAHHEINRATDEMAAVWASVGVRF